MTQKFYAPLLLAMLVVASNGKADSLKASVSIAKAPTPREAAKSVEAIESQEASAAAAASNEADVAVDEATTVAAAEGGSTAVLEVEKLGPREVGDRLSTGEPAVDGACAKAFATLDALAAGTEPAALPTVAEVKGCQTMLILSGSSKITSLAKMDTYLRVTKAVGSEDTAVLDKDLYSKTMTDPTSLSLLNSYLNASYGLAGLYQIYVLPNAVASLNDAKGAVARLSAKAEAGTISDIEVDNLNTLNLVLPIKQKKVTTLNAQIKGLYGLGFIAQVTAQVTSLKAYIEAQAAAPQAEEQPAAPQAEEEAAAPQS